MVARQLDPEWWWWRPEHEYLSVVVEATDMASRRISQMVASAAGNKKQLDFGPVLRLARPHDNATASSLSSRDDVRTFFGKG